MSTPPTTQHPESDVAGASGLQASPEPPDEPAALPDGRELDPGRSRWEGVLDRTAVAWCRRNGIPLGYDCAQNGWVPLTCQDTRPPVRFGASGTLAPSSAPAPDDEPAAHAPDRALCREFRDEVEATVSRVRAGEIEPDRARKALVDRAVEEVEALEGVADPARADRVWWALRVAIERGMAEVAPTASEAAVEPTPELSFREWTDEDVEVYRGLLDDPAVWEHLPEPYPSPFTDETARHLIQVASFGFHHETRAVVRSGTPVGQCLLRFDPPFADARAAEIAYWLGREHWGRGIMSEIVPRFTRRAFQEHDVDVIYAWIEKGHEASLTVARRAGYRRDRFPLEGELAASRDREGFIRLATYRREWVRAPTP